MNVFLANCISFFHVLIILFVLLAPFSNIPYILFLHIMFCITLVIHWYLNSNVCALSILESKFRGLDSHADGFIHKFVAPMYDVSETNWSNFCWMVTLVLMSVSSYKLYHSEKLKEAMIVYNNKDTVSIFESLRILIS